jgi:phosphopantothenoylcysteine decarboxylase / phosphopantothenate---cysteine ligase
VAMSFVNQSQVMTVPIVQADGVHQATRSGDDRRAATGAPQDRRSRFAAGIDLYFFRHARGAADNDHRLGGLPNPQHVVCDFARLRGIEQGVVESHVLRGSCKRQFTEAHPAIVAAAVYRKRAPPEHRAHGLSGANRRTYDSSMARILITSGPTRQYLDPVRYLTNASSGRMGRALAEAALARGHQVVVVSGPVALDYPGGAEVRRIVSTEDLLEACQELFPACDGVIGAAAPCDYRPLRVETHKIAKTGQPLELHLIETPDVMATLGAARRGDQWLVGFALETDDQRFRALTKLERKSCDLIVLNGPEAMDSLENNVEVLDREGSVVAALSGTKESVARGILDAIESRLITGRVSR